MLYNLSGEYPFFLTAFLQIVTFAAVSYTHLDVYKRQEMRIYIANLGKYNEGELVGAWFTPPVDFEEVDVYKRQACSLLRLPVMELFPFGQARLKNPQ